MNPVKNVNNKRVLAIILSVAVAASMMPVFQPISKAGTERKVNLAILSDIHYVTPEQAEGQAADDFVAAEKTEMRMMSEIDKILDQALDDAGKTDPDAMLVCGDLCSNGELENEEGLAGKLQAQKGRMDNGDGIYVINGNHDINNS